MVTRSEWEKTVEARLETLEELHHDLTQKPHGSSDSFIDRVAKMVAVAENVSWAAKWITRIIIAAGAVVASFFTIKSGVSK